MDRKFEDVPILKINEEKHIITGVVYEPNVPDSQGDFMDAETIEKIAYDFMEHHQNIDIKHDFKANDKLKIVESYITKTEVVIGGRKVQPGTWIMSVKVNDGSIWESVKKGEFNGFSMGGTGVKEEIRKGDHKMYIKSEEAIAKELKEIVDLALEPINQRLDALEKEDIKKENQEDRPFKGCV